MGQETERPVLKPGDIFCTSFGGTFLAKAILRAERRQSKDKQAELSHAGIIIDRSGITYEALARYSNQDLWKTYGKKNCKLLIGRHKLMTAEKFMYGYGQILDVYGSKKYPWWRLLLFKAGLADNISVGPAVCSELAMRFLVEIGLKNKWQGWNPDDVADMIVRDRMFDIIYHQNITSYDPRYLDAGGEQ